MPIDSIPAGERLAALSGVALILLMLLDWFGGRNAWQLKFVDLLLLGIAVLAVALAASRLASEGRGALGGGLPGVVLTVTGGLAVGVMLTLVLESSGGTVPLVLSLLAAAGILGGGLLALRGSSPSREPRLVEPPAGDRPASPRRPPEREPG